MSRPGFSSLLVLVTGSLLFSTSAQSQNRQFWEEIFPPSRQQDYYERSKRNGSTSSVRTYSPSASVRPANTRPAHVSRPYDDDDDPTEQKLASPQILEGGPRPDISPISPKPVSVSTGQSAGTIVIDLVDTRTQKVVWRGWAQDAVAGMLANQDKMAEKVREAVTRMLARLPSRM